ncbi:CPBP family intramembrane metalloprotease [bacterium]|nr:CPBP family intramembrane metalloprotease [bacterium]
MRPIYRQERDGYGGLSTILIFIGVWFVATFLGSLAISLIGMGEMLVETDLEYDSLKQFETSLQQGVYPSHWIGNLFYQIVLLLIVSFLIRRQTSWGALEYMGVARVSWRAFGFWMGVFIVFTIVSEAVVRLAGLETGEWYETAYKLTQSRGLMFAVVCVGAPVVEELLFRGFLFRGIKKSFGPVVAIVITTAFFAYAHVGFAYNVTGLVFVTLLGALFGLMRDRTDSVLPGMAAHFVNNTVFFGLVALGNP